ncbi:MAG: MBOAT family protein [Flavobacteriales bacterium]|nr:MBOAT family protein [Flavobacteriales bacterium]
MVFSSPVFLFLFLPVVLLLVMCVGTLKARNTVLTIASLFFYAWGEVLYAWVMLASILLNYVMGRWLEASVTHAGRKVVLTLALLANLGMLGWFKYANFIGENLGALFHSFGLELPPFDPVHLPIGISFFTFQGLSYVIDVYRREVPAQRKPGHIALYIALFPQLIAGPIVRYQDVAAEIDERRMDVKGFAIGARRFIIGLGKKLLIADTCARVADAVFALPDATMPASVAWLGTIAYSIQIYFDFSGYSDMAIGMGRMFGFHFLENFNFPYIASSVRELWQRWHISLTTWFRDYVYIPLGGSRGGTFNTYRNLVAVFLLTGLWHGASWNFLFWGLFHGLFLVFERLGLERTLKRLPYLLGVVYTLLIWNLSWALFHTETLDLALNFARSLFGMASAPGHLYASVYLSNDVLFALILGACASTPILRTLLGRIRERASAWTPAIRSIAARSYEVLDVTVHVGILLLCAMHMASSTYDPFIYFRF